MNLEQELRDLKARVEAMETKPQTSEEQFIDVKNITSLFKTITSATDLTNATAIPAKNIYDQVFIDTSTATKKLYIYDGVGLVWRSCTIA